MRSPVIAADEHVVEVWVRTINAGLALSILLFRPTRPASLQTRGENRNSLVAFSGNPRYGTATERLPSVAVRKASNTGKITGWYRKLF
jgi:hypothetical protein